MSIAMLARAPALCELRHDQAFLIGTLRLWVVTRHMGCCPMAPLAERLGTVRAAARFHLLIEQIGSAWPEPFCASPPCSPRLSHDEATFAAMIEAAADRRAFDLVLSDLVGADERERLYASVAMLTGTRG